jgi:hypothetical protein
MHTSKYLPWILTIVMIAVLSRPALPQTVSASSSSHETISITENNGVQKWSRNYGPLSDFNIEVKGKIEVTEDDKDVKGMSDDGYLQISKTVFGSKRSIVMESLGGGKIKKEYFEGRTKMEWDTNGKAWLGEILPDLVRSSTVGAEGRVNRIFKQGGANAVLTEIEELEGDYVKAHYARLLLEKNIPSSDIPKVINTIADELSSDYYLSGLLKDAMPKLLTTEESANAYFRATEKIGSDYYRTLILKEALKKYAASPAQVKSILNAATSIGSDYYLSVILTSLLEEEQVKEESLNELIKVTSNIESDHYRTEVLMKALQKQGISKEALRNAVTAVGDIGSDYYKTSVFNAMAERNTLDPDVQIKVINIIKSSVGSDYYKSATLNTLLQHQNFSDESFEQLLDAAGDIGSDNYAADVIMHAGEKATSTNRLASVLKTAANIDSDHYLTTVLQELAPKVKSADNSVKEVYRQTAKSIDSETYYGRAIRAIE